MKFKSRDTIYISTTSRRIKLPTVRHLGFSHTISCTVGLALSNSFLGY